MTKPMIRIHNTETNEVIDREMTDIEFVEYKKEQAQFEAVKLAKAARVEAKAELLQRLGITEDEAKLLLS